MRSLLLLCALLAALIAPPVRADEIYGLQSQNRVALTTNFSGTDILVFGAIRQSAERMEDDAPFHVIVTVEGPRQPVSIWRKAQRFGIWINTDMVSMASVPSFYAVATTGPLAQILSPGADAEHRISLREIVRMGQAEGDVTDPALFAEAMIRLRRASGQYLALDRWVSVNRDILFNVNISLPANLIEGGYTTRMFLLRDGEVVSRHRTAIFVRKEGFERWLSQLAFDNPLAYGLLALLLALVAGWGASEAARLLRR